MILPKRQGATAHWLALPALVCAFACNAPAAEGEGINVGKPSALRQLVPADQIERQANTEYVGLKRSAKAQRALAPDDHPEVQRLRAIAARIIPFASRFNARAAQWQWEINLIGSKQINAFCMPGGKIVFFTGLLNGLKLSDDEAAAVMGHEIAHALREHARERMAKNELTSLGANLLGQLLGNGKYTDAFQAGGNLLSLSFSREDESEADLVGLDLAARAGYDPRAGVTLWEKMATANRGAPPQWLSTHPSGPSRIRDIEQHLPDVLPLYEKASTNRPQQPISPP